MRDGHVHVLANQIERVHLIALQCNAPLFSGKTKDTFPIDDDRYIDHPLLVDLDIVQIEIRKGMLDVVEVLGFSYHSFPRKSVFSCSRFGEKRDSSLVLCQSEGSRSTRSE